MRKKIEVTSDQWRDAEPQHAPHDTTKDGVKNDGDGADGVSPSPPAPIDPAAPEAERETVNGTEAYIVALQADLDEARRQIEEIQKQLLYSQAEFQNFRRRKEDEQRDLARFANAELIRSLLPILDNFDRALQAAEKSRNFDALVGGVSGTSKQLQTFLQKAGVTPIESVGKEFDPNFHEAIGHADNSDLPPNTVADEVQRGYMMHDRVLRPALVRVAQG